MQNEPSTTPSVPQPPSPTPTPGTSGQHAPSGLAIAAMVTGISAIITGWIPFLGLLAGVAAIILAVMALKHSQNKGMSITGLVTGIVGTIWGFIIAVLIVIGLIFAGGTAAVISEAVDTQNKTVQAQIDAKKDFEKGDIAKFDQFEVKAISVQRNYVPENEFQRASEGKELVVVNVEVKNTGDAATFSSYSLELNVNGVATSPNFLEVAPVFTGGTISKDATAKGNIVFEIEKDATDLKLQYEVMVYDLKSGTTQNLVYTLKI